MHHLQAKRKANDKRISIMKDSVRAVVLKAMGFRVFKDKRQNLAIMNAQVGLWVCCYTDTFYSTLSCMDFGTWPMCLWGFMLCTRVLQVCDWVQWDLFRRLSLFNDGQLAIVSNDCLSCIIFCGCALTCARCPLRRLFQLLDIIYWQMDQFF